MTLFDPESTSPAAPEGPLVRVKLVVAYDGSRFHGFAAQPGVATVAGTLVGTLERVLGHPVELTCAGRTDAGVHGWGQVVSFDARADRFDAAKVQSAVNGLCGPAIVVRSAEVAPDGFDARFAARSRLYRYTVLNRPVPDPFLAATSWHVAQPLEWHRLALACDPLLGEHDFTSFCRRPKGRVGGSQQGRVGGSEQGRAGGSEQGQEEASLVRRVLDARWELDEAAGEGVWRFWIEATAFCHQMVRSIVGTLVDVGTGKRTAADVTAALAARDRSAAGPVAPPQGLCLWQVRY